MGVHQTVGANSPGVPHAFSESDTRICIRGRRYDIVERDSLSCGDIDRRRIAGVLRIGGQRLLLIERPQESDQSALEITRLLTSRELQIVYCIAAGKCDKAIARELAISEHTVKEHVRRAFNKLNVTKRAALVAELARAGLTATAAPFR